MDQVQGQPQPDLLTLPWPLVVVPAMPEGWQRALVDSSDACTQMSFGGSGWRSVRSFDQRRMQVVIADSAMPTFDPAPTAKALWVEMLGGATARGVGVSPGQQDEFDRLVHGEAGAAPRGLSVADDERFRSLDESRFLSLGGLGDGQVVAVVTNTVTDYWLTDEFVVDLLLRDFVEPVRVRVGGHRVRLPDRISLVVESPDRYVAGRSEVLRSLGV